ncbi:MAG: molybdenum ABC transporter ATP-binding protein [Betaproteobacteria bacterium]|nr:molybdenum ABC transporter ATP-binding protein [Betaproteobacteria bacterium]
MLAVDVQQRLGTFELDARFASAAPVTALFGRSGAGKTRLVNAIAGVARPDRGTIRFGDSTFFDSVQGIHMAPEDRRVGYVFQDGLLFPHLTVAANLDYGARNRARPAGPASPIARDHVIELLGLVLLLHRKPRDLSGGEKQRVALGRALLSQPRLLLLDEPLAGVDSGRKSEILAYIEKLRDEFGLPIVLVTHAIDEVVRLADTLVLIDEGRVQAAGAVEEIMGRLDLAPLTGRHEAGAVIDARVASHDTHYELTHLAFSGGSLAVPRVIAAVGDAVRVRIRARDVSLALDAPQGLSIQNVLPATVESIRDESGPIVDVRVLAGESPLIARITRQSLDRLRLAPGQRVHALVKAVSLDRRSVGYS